MSTAVTLPPERSAILIAMVPTPHPASSTRLSPGDRRTLQQVLCREPAAGMDDAFPDDRHEDVRIEPFDLGGLKTAAPA